MTTRKTRRITIELTKAILDLSRSGWMRSAIAQRNIKWLVAHELGACKRHIGILCNRDGTTVCHGIERAKQLLKSSDCFVVHHYKTVRSDAEYIVRRMASDEGNDEAT